MNKEEIIALQKVGEKYTREYMFKMLREREDIISKGLQEIEDREVAEEISFADYYDANVFEIGNNGNNKVKIKK